MWNDATGYEKYVGHWSRAIAPRFLAWLCLSPGLKWLDVACGTGALTSTILERCDPTEVAGLDGSADYLDSATAHCRDPRARFVLGDASALPFAPSTFDVSVSGLALNFVDHQRALAEQRRVVGPGGTVAAYVWDYAGEYEFARRFWDAAARVDPRAATYDPGYQAAICSETNLRNALGAAGCREVETCVFDDLGKFPSAEAYWNAFDVRQGSTFKYLSLLTDEERLRLRKVVLSDLPPSGPVKLKVRALAVKGRVPMDL